MAKTSSQRYPNLSVVGTASINGVNPRLLAGLQAVAANLGQTITIQSGYRSPAYSAKVGGYANDPHSRGEAVDAYIDGQPIGEVVPLATLSHYGLEGGNQPGFYPAGGNGGRDAEHVQIPGSGANKSLISPVLTQATGVPSQGNVPPPGLKNGQPDAATAMTVSDTNPVGGDTTQMTAAQAFVNEVSRQTGVAPSVLNYWINAEGTYAPNGTGGFNFLNMRPDPYHDDKYTSLSPGKFEQFNTLQGAIDATVNRIREPFMSALMNVVKSGGTPAQQWEAIGKTGWDIGHYSGSGFDPNVKVSYPGPFVTGVTGSTGANGGTSDTGTSGTGLSSSSFAPTKGPAPIPFPNTAPPARAIASAYKQGGQGTKNNTPNVIGSLLKMLNAPLSGGPTYRPVSLTAPNITPPPVGTVPPTDLSPFTITPATARPLTPTPLNIQPSPYQILGVRP